ncbi:ott like deaminase protein [Rutstroemia sp. NJR-2017a BBW]|nr:ott like deaminase protein [Rutstroemia sp. NJR-2017a BBW]
MYKLYRSHSRSSVLVVLVLRNSTATFSNAEPSSLSDTVLEEDCDSDDNEFAHQISDSGHRRLEQSFLDCLAEFAANKKDGTAVACSAMKKAENNVIIWIARNEGFSDMDKPAFDKLGKLLGSLSCNRAGQSEVLLWEEIVLYHQNRIEHSYIPNLRASFKAYDAVRRRNSTANTPETSAISDVALSDLRTLLFDRNINSTSTLEKHIRLVVASYNLCRTKNIEELYSSPSATSKSKSLWLDICLLARLRVAFQHFKDIAITLPSFKQSFVLLHPQTRLSARSIWIRPSTVVKIEREFAKRWRQKPNVHAEVQILMFLNTNEFSASGLFPYFGCSKLSCFMCNRFIQSYGRFTIRGCHGRLFKPWTAPNVDRLLPGQADWTAKALILVQKEVEKKLKGSVKGHIRYERTSVIGGSSVLDGLQEERSQRKLQIDRLRMKAERDRVAEMFRR